MNVMNNGSKPASAIRIEIRVDVPNQSYNRALSGAQYSSRPWADRLPIEPYTE